MKNIIIRSGSLRMGGLEKVLIEFLKLLNLEENKIFLFIEDNCEEENIFEKDIPKGIELFFLKEKKIIEKTKYYRENRKNFFYKIMYNLYMEKERYIVEKNTKKNIEKLKKKYGEINLFIDYDWGATKYVEKLRVDKKIVWLHNSVKNLMKKKRKIHRFGKRLKKYDAIVTICNEMKDEVINLYPFLEEKIKMIYNPFDFNEINFLSKKYEELNSFDKELLEKNYIIAVSRLDTVQKDYSTLLKGYKKALKKGISEYLYILGDGPNKKEIYELSKKLKIDDKVIFLGRRKNPYIWMEKSKFFVHSSKYEGFGLVLVEAMALKKCVLSSDCKVGPKEILDNGKYGLIFKTGNFEELGNLIFKISKNQELRKKFENSGFERKNIFSGINIKNNIDKLISEVTL